MDEKNILVAKTEFTKFLSYKLMPCLYQGIKHIWKTSKMSAPKGQVYVEFQNNLRQVKIWNQDVIENEYDRIVQRTKCKYLDDIIKKIFVLNTQILAADNGKINEKRKIKVQVPPASKFLHHCYQECARCFYENVMLMDDRPEFVTQMQQSENLQKSYKIIINCIENTIRNLLPIEDLLFDYESPDEEMHYSPKREHVPSPRQASPARQASPVINPAESSFNFVPPSDGPSNMFEGIYEPEPEKPKQDNSKFLDLFRPKTPNSNIIDTLFQTDPLAHEEQVQPKPEVKDDHEIKTVYFNRHGAPPREETPPPLEEQFDFPLVKDDDKNIDFETSDRKSLFDEPLKEKEQDTFIMPPPPLENHDTMHFFDDI